MADIAPLTNSSGQQIIYGNQVAPTANQVSDSSGTPLPTTTAPTNAGNVTQTGQFTIPTIPMATGNTTSSQATVAGAQSNIDSLTAAREAQIQQEQQSLQNNPQSQSLLSKILGAPTPAQTAASAQAQTGIDPTTFFAQQNAQIASIKSLTDNYNALNTAMQTQLAATQDKEASEDFINNQTSQIQRNAAPQMNALSSEINAQTAVLQAMTGNFNQAQSFVQQAVSDATADQQYNVNLYNAVQSQNQDIISALDAPYAEAFTASMNQAQAQLTQAQSDKTAVGNLMINPATAGAGVKITDTLAQAESKVQNYLKTTSGSTGIYTIQNGDTLFGIAQSKGILLSALESANPNVDPSNLRPGQTINLPANSASQSSSTNYTATNIPSNLKAQILSDLQNVKGVNLAQLENAYPEVDTSYLATLIKQ